MKPGDAGGEEERRGCRPQEEGRGGHSTGRPGSPRIASGAAPGQGRCRVPSTG